MTPTTAGAIAVLQTAGAEQLSAELWILTGAVIVLLVGIGLFLPVVVAWTQGDRAERRVSGSMLSWLAAALGTAGVALLWMVPGVEAGPLNVVSLDARPSMAVLPLTNPDGQASDQYLVDGMHDEILTHLAKIGGLKVISRTSVMDYRDSPKSLETIADELGARYLIAGRITGTGDDARLGVEFTDALTGEELWAESYDRPMSPENMLLIRSDMANQIARAVNIVMTPEESNDVARAGTSFAGAYDYYLKGLQYAHRPVREEAVLRLALSMYQEALRIDPDYAEAHAELIAVALALYGAYNDEADRRLGEEAMAAALELGPDLALVQSMAGLYHRTVSQDAEASERYFLRALELEPGYPRAFNGLAALYRAQGRWDEALVASLRAEELDPRSFLTSYQVARQLVIVRRFEEAAPRLDELSSRFPESPFVYFWRATMHLSWTGDRELAGSVLELAAEEADMVGFHLVDWDFEDRVLMRVLSDHFDEPLARRTLSDPGDPAAYHLAKGDHARRNGMMTAATAHYDSARVVVEPIVAGLADRTEGTVGRPPTLSAAHHGRLGLAYSGLGRVDDALDQARLALATLESLRGWSLVFNLATVAELFVLTGQYDDALAQLERLLSQPSYFSPAMIEVDPIWDPIRDRPGYAGLMERYETR